MTSTAVRSLRIPSLIALAISCACGGGCISASLATNTGPRPEGRLWSMARRQQVHVGETVRFDFVLQDGAGRFMDPTGLADYCVVIIGQERIEVTPDIRGHFQFSYTFDQVQPGDTIDVTATALRQKGGRDFMNIRGQWLRSDSPYEEIDRALCADDVRLQIYEAPIQLTLARPADDLNPETGKLKILRNDGATTSVFIDVPGRPGFKIRGPEPDGYYRVSYTPKGDELNPIGTTEVEFTIHDMSGRPHHASATLETP